ncbi:N-acetylmuramyl-L-alanine amidase, negative regulator of AmpC, AmpD [Sulfitobacter noctilucae]|uniref:N-acetylmuramoyl-L-alanine amidase n=1 Tax=Sulfitobacter noctilucae TaxID=1342302 RepID=UPI0004684858|nr:N-acetylmuramoyl-L-alanine amidase [Sulfitobacter noctilucae]KIN61735.1 N-acetylmuramyl-L-alanine amidase, negative regulator of AmpC, AmpD [Sulfitobacter noctilucae]
MPPLRIYDHPSPNCGPRRGGLTPTLIVLHYTAMHSVEAAIERLCDPEAEVSAHYVICRSGKVTRLVPEADRAWHAGQGTWAGQDDINSRSLGVELDNTGTHPFPHPQMQALETLLEQLMKRWDIAPAGVIGHSDMAPGRKTDPGPHFDWARLASKGLAAPLSGSPPHQTSCDSFRTVAQQAGYPADVPFDSLLHSTRLRTAPWRRGPLHPDDYTLPRP